LNASLNDSLLTIQFGFQLPGPITPTATPMKIETVFKPNQADGFTGYFLSSWSKLTDFIQSLGIRPSLLEGGVFNPSLHQANQIDIDPIEWRIGS
jgi:hypothetical protein